MKEKIITKNFCFIFLALFCVSNIMYMLMSTMSEYTTTFGVSTMIAGMVTGIYTIGGIFSRLYAGSGAQRWGWRRFAVAFMLLHLAACACYFVVDNVAVLLLVRFIHGLGYGGAANIILTIGMSILPKSRYGEASGYFMLAPTLAIASGPYVGAYIYDTFGPTGCFLMTMALSVLMLLSILAMDFKEIDPGAQKVTQTKTSATGLNRIFEVKAVPISFCMFLFAFGYVAVMSFYRLYSVETNLTTEFSYFFLMYAVVLICTRPMAGKIQDKYGDNVILYPGIVAQAIGLFLIAWKPCMLTIVLCAIGCGLGYGTLNSCCNSIACRQASQERRSYAVSTFWVFCDGGMGLGPTILGAVAGAAGYTARYYAAAVVTIVALPIYYFAWGRSGGKSKPSA
ncbi:MAG: MFS transporter [Clostridiales bacterium]|nr:MFS transporter [Clostridiales bacterium]